MQLPKMSRKGFTLIELLVVIGILTVLLAIVLIAVNPGRQFSQANDTQRRSDINAVLNAVHQYAADNKGALPSGITTTAKTLCEAGTSLTCPASSIDLCADLVTEYLADIPRDPLTGANPRSEMEPTSATLSCDGATTGYRSGYTVVQSATGNRITVCTTPEITPPATICVTR